MASASSCSCWLVFSCSACCFTVSLHICPHVGEQPCARQQLQLDVTPLLVCLLWYVGRATCPWPRRPGEPAWRRSPGAGGQGASASFLHLGADAESACQCVTSGGARARYFICASATRSAGSKFPVFACLARGSAAMYVRMSIRFGPLSDKEVFTAFWVRRVAGRWAVF